MAAVANRPQKFVTLIPIVIKFDTIDNVQEKACHAKFVTMKYVSCIINQLVYPD